MLVFGDDEAAVFEAAASRLDRPSEFGYSGEAASFLMLSHAVGCAKLC